MSLDLGKINGVIGLDDSPFSEVLDGTQDKLRKWASSTAKEAEKGGEEGGKRFADGWGKKALLLLGSGGVAVATAFTTALVKGMNLEPAHDKIAATLNLAPAEADAASKAAGKLYASNWGESMEDAANRTGLVLSSVQDLRGKSADEIARMTGLFSAFADGFEVDMGRATQVAGQMVSAGLAKDVEEAVDLLTVSFQKVPANVREDVLDAADEYGPFFSQLGISGETAMTMLVDASEKGMYGIDKTGDALKEFTIRATDLSTATGDAYEALGLSQQNMTNDLLAGGEKGEQAFAKIIMGLDGIKDPAKQSEVALALFGTPLEDLGTGEIPQFIDMLANMDGGLGDVAGATERMGDTMSDNASSNIKAFLRTIEQGATEYIGGKFLPALNDLTGKLITDWGPVFEDANEKLETFGRWVQDNEGWLGPLTTAVLVFGGALAGLALVGFISNLGGMGAALTLLAGKFGITTAAVWAKQAALLVAGGASKAFTAAQWLMNAALSANPIGLIVLALAGLVTAFVLAYQNSEEFRAIVDGALNFVKETADNVVQWFKNDFLGFWTGVFDGAGKKLDEWGRGADQTLQDVQKFFGDNAKEVEGWATDVGARFEDARKWGEEKMNKLRDGTGRAFDQIKSGFELWSKAFGQLLSGDFDGFAQTAGTIMGNMKDNLLGIFNGVKDGAKKVWDLLPADLKKPIQDAVRWINDTFVGGINGLLGKLSISFRVPTIPGFAEGGYTGNGAKYTPAGVVHAGEVVWSQDDVAAWGGPLAVDTMRRARGAAQEDIAGFAEGGIVPNATQGFRGYDPSFLNRILAWARATGRTWYMTGLGGARSYAQQAELYRRYLAGTGPLAANPAKGGPHMYPGVAMDLSPRPGEYAGPRSMLGAFGLGLTVPGEPWHVGNLGGRSGGMTGGGPGFDFGIGALIDSLLKKLPSASPWSDILVGTLKKMPEGIIKAVMDSFGGFSMGTDYARPGIAAVAENGAELVLGKQLRNFQGGERVLNPRQTAEALSGGSSGCQCPSTIVVVDADDALIGRMRTEARNTVHSTVETARRLR